MPIRLPETLPAFTTLQNEGVYVMRMSQAERQDIRPLRVALLNLMPLKIETETQFSRLIGSTPLQIDLHLIRMSNHVSKNTNQSHMAEFYHSFEEIKTEKFDGLIITGAPIEHMPFDEVDYWEELKQVFNWTQTHVHSTMAVCWAGMAGLAHHYGVAKHLLEYKRFGCLRHRNLDPTSPYMRGISDDFVVPVSRWTEILREDIISQDGLEILIETFDGEPCLIESKTHRTLFNLHHFEYDSHTLKGEYDRDIAASRPINVPANYYPDDDPSKQPQNRWKSTAHLLYGNWINEIYQTTPYEIERVGQDF